MHPTRPHDAVLPGRPEQNPAHATHDPIRGKQERIISGSYRGRHIHPPSGFNARPTTDFAKESLFNILIHQMDIGTLDVLDLFSGTGSIAYEFASRGARSVVAVENNPRHHRFISQTVRELDLTNVEVLRADVFRYLLKPVQGFDLIFADPPYSHPRLADLPGLVLDGPLLLPGDTSFWSIPPNMLLKKHPRFLQIRNTEVSIQLLQASDPSPRSPVSVDP
ncbi:MAG: RsmD family RNA methyltransferase [Bacteroidales bacterium]